MKILYFHQHFSTPSGAAGIRSYEMARRLIAAGHQVTMVCGSYASGVTGLKQPFAKGKRRGNVDGIDIIEFDLSYGNKDGFMKRAATFMKFALRSIMVAMREPTDLVFATTTPLTAGIPGIFAKWLRRKPFVFEVRDLWPELPRAMGVITNPVILWAMGVLEWTSYHSADRLIGLSPGIVDGIVDRGIDKDRIAMIPNGCDTDLFGPHNKPWIPEGIRPSDFLAIFTGTHGKANGLDAVLDAAVVLKQRKVTGIKILLVGDGAEKAALMQRAAEEDLDDIVVFHDPIAKTQLARLMASADVGLQILANVPAFYYGTSPNKFFDYLAAGIPVVTNYPGWVAELVTEHKCGIAVPPEDAESLAGALIDYASKHREKNSKTMQTGLELLNKRFARYYLATRFRMHIENVQDK